MKAFIYTGGTIHKKNISERPEGDDLIIAADGGYHNAKAMGVMPRILLGDFDSLDRTEPLPEGIELLQVPAEKDDTDTQLAVKLALEKGAKSITIIGGLDGRLDHTLSNLAILEELSAKHISVVITNGQNRARFLRDNGVILIRDGFRYFSILAADPVVKGVTVEGCKYPLKKAKLSRTNQYAVSNEIVGNCALIEIKKGGAWVVESNDK
ncbi:MAG: thiamine diphosphokinase [Clostridia bacterium]|nr:thiamine diphosphokinase [Clostridia bacterium]